MDARTTKRITVSSLNKTVEWRPCMQNDSIYTSTRCVSNFPLVIQTRCLARRLPYHQHAHKQQHFGLVAVSVWRFDAQIHFYCCSPHCAPFIHWHLLWLWLWLALKDWENQRKRKMCKISQYNHSIPFTGDPWIITIITECIYWIVLCGVAAILQRSYISLPHKYM